MKYRAVAALAAVTVLVTPAGRAAVAGVVHNPVCVSCHGNGDAVVQDARRYLGIPYVWGGECAARRGCTGLDCSGLTKRVFADLGTELPRTAAEQQHAGTPVRDLKHARPGDLLFYEPDSGGAAHHVAIYEGGDRLVEAPQEGVPVSERKVYSGVIAIRRVELKGEK
jgi:cell wall-associated NlpC family hydrolase